MKCKTCEWSKDGECVRASQGHLGEIEDVACLLRCQISLLRDIWAELAIQDEKGEEWKE